MTLTEGFVQEEVFIDFGAEILYGDDQAYHIVTKGTVDEDVLAALASKDVTQEKLIAAVKARLT